MKILAPPDQRVSIIPPPDIDTESSPFSLHPLINVISRLSVLFFFSVKAVRITDFRDERRI